MTVADPMVRFHQLVIEPYLADLEAGRATRSGPRPRTPLNPRSYGPHFEALAAEWTARYAAAKRA